MIARGQTFKDITIYLDGCSFYECRFERCTIVVSGLMGSVLEAPHFQDCHWVLNGPARNTLQFLTNLHRGGAHQLVENTLDVIRGKRQPGGAGSLH